MLQLTNPSVKKENQQDICVILCGVFLILSLRTAPQSSSMMRVRLEESGVKRDLSFEYTYERTAGMSFRTNTMDPATEIQAENKEDATVSRFFGSKENILVISDWFVERWMKIPMENYLLINQQIRLHTRCLILFDPLVTTNEPIKLSA